jgi:hypothetical protein
VDDAKALDNASSRQLQFTLSCEHGKALRRSGMAIFAIRAVGSSCDTLHGATNIRLPEGTTGPLRTLEDGAIARPRTYASLRIVQSEGRPELQHITRFVRIFQGCHGSRHSSSAHCQPVLTSSSQHLNSSISSLLRKTPSQLWLFTLAGSSWVLTLQCPSCREVRTCSGLQGSHFKPGWL